MRVLHVISGIDPQSGGTVAAVAGLTRAQSAQGAAAALATTWTHGHDLSTADRLTEQGVAVHLIGPTHQPLARHPDIKPTLRQHIAASDIVHIHALWEEVQHQAAKTAYKQNVPYVITPHGMLDPWSLSKGWLKKHLYLTLRMRKNLNHAAAIHFTTKTEQQLARPLRLTPPAIVEPNGIDLSEFESLPPAGAFRKRFTAIGDRAVVLFLSRLHPKKGIELLIQAFAKACTSNEALVIAGPGPKDYQATLERLVQEKGLNDRVIFTGMLYGPDRLAAMADADLFVLPSYQENFGIAVVESLAVGTPVIISDQVNIHQEITEAGVGGVVPTNADRLTEELHAWLANPARRQQASQRAKPFVASRYDWGAIARRWLTHYEQITRLNATAHKETTPNR